MAEPQHSAEVQDVQIFSGVIQRAPGFNQIVRLLLAHFAHGKRTKRRHPFQQRAHRHAARRFQQAIIKIHRRRVAQIDHDARRSFARRSRRCFLRRD